MKAHFIHKDNAVFVGRSAQV